MSIAEMSVCAASLGAGGAPHACPAHSHAQMVRAGAPFSLFAALNTNHMVVFHGSHFPLLSTHFCPLIPLRAHLPPPPLKADSYTVRLEHRPLNLHQ